MRILALILFSFLGSSAAATETEQAVTLEFGIDSCVIQMVRILGDGKHIVYQATAFEVGQDVNISGLDKFAKLNEFKRRNISNMGPGIGIPGHFQLSFDVIEILLKFTS